ncbi:MAG: hypothetical protein IK118_07400 [Clostridia bacterium]|nr:hypothetical protein [Clostridia bacterium]MBR5428157.1 hypothetical protein [Clostridia bacterium]
MKKSSAVFLIALLAAALTVGAIAAAVAGARKKAGSYKRETIDRVDFTVENTQQSFSLADGGDFVAEITFTAAKTEAEFFAMIEDITVAGEGIVKTEVIPADAEGGYKAAVGAVLPAKDGKALPLRWTVRVYFSASGPGVVSPVLRVEFTSGVKREASDGRVFTVPLTFTVTE